MSNELKTQIPNPWDSLKKYTQARIAIGRCGTSVPTRELLDFKMSHAKAIDAVHIPLDAAKVVADLEALLAAKVHHLHSAAPGRSDYLRRPDWGRKLSDESALYLQNLPKQEGYDVALIVADGLSAHAVEKNILPMFELLLPALKEAGCSIAPVAVVEQGRVAIADEIASVLHAKMSVIFIGERPGLKTPDSLGIYLTFDPQPGTTDERRNCISNVRTEGLIYEHACSKLVYLLRESFLRQISGVNLKDEQESLVDTQTVPNIH
jgi:ethanolamine ammonia-lyase small subunit